MAIIIQKPQASILSSYSEPLNYDGSIVYGGQSSIITNIETTESGRSTFATRAGTQVIESSDLHLFCYDVFFRVDMLKMLESNTRELKFDILTSATRESLGTFTTLSGVSSPSDIISALFRGNKESARVARNNRAQNTIKSGIVDMKLYFEQCKIKKPEARNSDREIFGEKKCITLKKLLSKDSEKDIKNKVFIEQDFKSDRNSKKDLELSFRDEYIRLIRMGIDPASIFFPDPEYQMASKGYVRRTSDLHPRGLRRERVDLIRNYFSKTNQVVKSLKPDKDDPLEKDTVIAQEENVVDRYKVVKISFKLSEDELRDASSFVCRISVVDPEMGVVSDQLDIQVPHRYHCENYYIPDFLPEISISKNDKGIGDTAVDLRFSKIQDHKIKEIKIRSRKIKDDAPLSHAFFSERSTNSEGFSLKKMVSEKCYKQKRAFKLNDLEMIIGRSFPVTSKGIQISNIQKSSSQKGLKFNYVYSGIDIDNRRDGFILNCFSPSPDVCGMTVYRRMKGESKATPINYTQQSSIPPGENPTATAVGSNISQVGSTGRVHTFIDRFGKSLNIEKVFSYQKKIYLKSGVEVWDKKVLTVKNKKILKIVKVEIDNMSHPGQDGAIDSSSVSFEISGMMRNSNTDLILEILREEQKDEIFSDIIQGTRSSLSDLMVFGVTRTNLTDSSKIFMGYHKSGKFIDDGKNFPGPQPGNKYKYTVTAYLVNPEIIQKYFDLSANYNKSVLKRADHIFMPTFIQRVQNVAEREIQTTIGSQVVSSDSIAAFQNLKIQKYYSGRALASGAIENQENFEQDYDFEKYSTGDFKNSYVDLTQVSVDISTSGQSSITRSYSGCPVLRFQTSGDLNMLDFVVVTCTKGGVEKIAGSCMPDLNGQVFFVDYSGKDFIGQVEYFGTPVMINGHVGAKSPLGSTILLQNKPGNIRGAGAQTSSSASGGY